MQVEEPYSKRWIALVVLCVADLVVTIDNLVVAIALPSLSVEFGATTSQLQWVVTAYILVFSCLLLASGSLSDRFGRRKMLIIGLVWLSVASALAVTATNIAQLIAFRGLMGVGAAMIFPATLAAISDAFRDPREKNIAIGAWSATTGVGVIVGPILGGFVIDHFSWHSIFWINVPICVIGILGAVFFVRESTDPAHHRIDLVGMGLSILAVSALVFSIIEAPDLGWWSMPILSGLALSGVLMFLFIRWETQHPHPMLDMRLFRDKRFRGGNLSVMSAQVMIFGFAFMGTQYLQFILGYSAFEAGIHLLPFAISTAVAAVVSTILIPRLGYRSIVITGLVLSSLAALLAARISVSSQYGEAAFILFLFGVGYGTTTAPGTEAVMVSLPERIAGIGSAVNDTTRELGASLGVAIAGSIAALAYVNSLTVGLSGSGMPETAVSESRESVGTAIAVADNMASVAGPGSGDLLKKVASESFMNGFTYAMMFIAILGVTTAVYVFRLLPRKGQVSAPMDITDKQATLTDQITPYHLPSED